MASAWSLGLRVRELGRWSEASESFRVSRVDRSMAGGVTSRVEGAAASARGAAWCGACAGGSATQCCPGAEYGGSVLLATAGACHGGTWAWVAPYS